MKNPNKLIQRIAFILSVMVFGVVLSSQGQTAYRQTGSPKISMDGTSTMHDWTMTSAEASITASMEVGANGVPEKISSLSVTIPAESLKSGKGSMDKNAYSALKTSTHKQIIFQFTSADIKGNAILCKGNLTIAGVTKVIELEASYSAMQNQSLQVKGSKKIIMSEYGVEPPSFMFGSVKTGDAVTVSFDVTLAPIKL